MSVGSCIRKIRKEKGLKQKELASILKMPVSTISNYENDIREPNLEMIKKIAAALNVHEVFLIDDSASLNKSFMIESSRTEISKLICSNNPCIEGIGELISFITQSMVENTDVYFKGNDAYNTAVLELFDSISKLLDYTDYIDTGNAEKITSGIFEIADFIRYKTIQIYKESPETDKYRNLYSNNEKK